MAQVFVFGRVTADFELKTSAKQTPYVRFDIAEHIGWGQYARTQYWQVFAREAEAQRLVKAKVRKGSLVWLSGEVELESFVKRDGVTKDKRLKLSLDKWGFVPTGAAKGKPAAPEENSDDTPTLETAPEIDGEREPLPD